MTKNGQGDKTFQRAGGWCEPVCKSPVPLPSEPEQ